MRILFWDVEKAKKVEKPEVDVVDENGKSVTKPTFGEKAKTFVANVAVVATAIGAVSAAAVAGGKVVGKQKDKEIRDLTQRNADLVEENDNLWQEREHLLHPETEETEETPVKTREEGGVTITEF